MAQAKAAAPQIVIPNVKSGRATLHQKSKITTLVVIPIRDQQEKIILTYPNLSSFSTLESPKRPKVIAEIPGQTLIFSDVRASRSGNPMAQCGAGEEIYLHVVSLIASGRETLSVLTDSCWSSLESAAPPKFDPEKRTLTLRYLPDRTTVYHIGADGSVTP